MLITAIILILPSPARSSQHLKMMSLVVDGRPSRFCQQCGKFHDLTDFDGERR